MSFGFSVGDFLAVGKLTWQVYKATKDAPESFQRIHIEVLSLHAVLKEAEDTILMSPLKVQREERLATITNGCRSVMIDLEKLVNKYESLGTQSKRTWDRMWWGKEDIAQIRARLTSNVTMLTAFMSTSQGCVEQKLDKYIEEFQSGKRQGSIISVQTADSLSKDERNFWRELRKELEDIGITTSAFETNRDFILDWFRQALNDGAFEEQVQSDDGGNVSGEQAFSDSEEEAAFYSDEESIATDVRVWDFSSDGIPRVIRTGTSMPNSKTFLMNEVKQGPLSVPVDQESYTSNVPPTNRNSNETAHTANSKPSASLAAHDASSLWYRRPFLEATIGMRPSHEVLTMLDEPATPKRLDQSTLDRALLNACLIGDSSEKAISTLTRQGANLDAALFAACEVRESEATILALVEHGANVNAVDERGYTTIPYQSGDLTTWYQSRGVSPLILAAYESNKDVVQLLLAWGADIHFRPELPVDLGGRRLHGSALTWAVAGCNAAVVKTLLSAGADANERACANLDLTVLHVACGWNGLLDEPVNVKHCTARTRLIHDLLDNGADVDAPSEFEGSPLMTALRARLNDVATLLVERGADVPDAMYGPDLCAPKTPMDIAFVNNETVQINLLLKHGAVNGVHQALRWREHALIKEEYTISLLFERHAKSLQALQARKTSVGRGKNGEGK